MKCSVFVLAAVVITGPLLNACGADSDVSSTVGTDPYVIIHTKNIVLRNATIFVGDGGAPLVNYSILIEGDRIFAVGPAGAIKPPLGAKVIDLTGSSVMPGIIGLHNHLHMPGINLMNFTAPRMYLASGVTTIQTAGSADAIGELQLAKAVLNGDVPGPRVFTTAPYITGPGGNQSMFVPADIASASDFVNKWADLGVTGFKLYRHTDPVIAAVVIDEAHRRGLSVSGHLCSITYSEAAAMGIDRLEHGLNPATDFVSDKPIGECVPSRLSKVILNSAGPELGVLIDTLVGDGVTLTSTLAILESGFPHRPQADARSRRALMPSWRKANEERQERLAESLATTSSTPAYWDVLATFERRFVAAGGRLVAGPDTGRHVLPGYGDQRNFELLVEAGFSVAKAIQIMTHNGALELGIGADSGLVAAGYRADLVVISGDLETEPASIRDVEMVIKAGIAYDPTRLISTIHGQVGLH